MAFATSAGSPGFKPSAVASSGTGTQNCGLSRGVALCRKAPTTSPFFTRQRRQPQFCKNSILPRRVGVGVSTFAHSSSVSEDWTPRMHNRAFTFGSCPGTSFKVMAHLIFMSLDSGIVNASSVAFTAACLI